MARIRSGNLDRRITLQGATMAIDSFGEAIKTWTTFALAWASLKTLTGNEGFAAEQRRSRSTVAFKMRYQPGITPQMRVLHRGEVYEIDDVSEPDRNHEIVLFCHVFEASSGA